MIAVSQHARTRVLLGLVQRHGRANHLHKTTLHGISACKRTAASTARTHIGRGDDQSQRLEPQRHLLLNPALRELETIPPASAVLDKMTPNLLECD